MPPRQVTSFYTLYSESDEGTATTVKQKEVRIYSRLQQLQYQRVVDHFSGAGYVLEDVNGEMTELSELERKYLSKECFIRFLCAEKWNEQRAIARLERNLVWRRKMNLYDIEAVAADLHTHVNKGVCFTTGYTNCGQPLVYYFASKHHNDAADPMEKVKLLVYLVERSIDLMPAGIEEIGFIVDLSKSLDTSSTSFTIRKAMIQTMQAHYPERLGWAAVQNLGVFSKLLINVMWPFVDAYTKNKVGFDLDLPRDERMDPYSLLPDFGGRSTFKFKSETYWKDLLDICLVRNARELEKWRSAGARVGVSESEFKLGRCGPVGEY